MTPAPPRSLHLYVCLLLSLLLTGCSQTQPGKVTEPLVRHSSVHGGQQPISGATLQLYAVGTTGDGSAATPLLTQTVTSDANGNFNLTGAYTCPSASTLVYVVATGGNPGLSPGTNNTDIALMAALGPCGNLTSSTFITINELTTVGAIWPLAPFMASYTNIGSGSSDASALASGFTLASQYVNTTTGTAPGQNVPSGTTIPVTQLNTLADILSSCVNSAGGVSGDGSTCGTLFAATTPTGGTAPTDISGAGLNIANNPTANISNLYALLTPTAAFQPTLASPPADWTVGLLAPAGLSVSPTALTFPAADLNFPATTQTLTVTNNGTTATNFSNYLSLSGAAASDFSFGPCSLNAYGYLSAGASCQMQVTFTPSAVGPRNATLLFSGGFINAPLSIPMSGSGLAGTGGPITLSPSSLTFTLAGVSQPVTVANYGTTPVAIGSITLTTSSGTTKFAETDNCGSTLAAQSICTISVQAVTMNTNLQTPNTQSTGMLTLIDSDPSGNHTVPLTASSPLVFDATPMNFGSWAIGVRAVPAQYVTLSSGINGTGFTAIGSISGPNASDFALLGPTSCTGRPNIPCQLILAFTPSGLGLRTASLVTNFGSIALSGTGLPDGPFFTVTPAPITTAAPSNIVVLNNGSTPLSLSGTVTGVDAGDFALTNPCLISGSDNPNIPPGASCNLTVAFIPSQPGLRTATLTVTDATSGLSETTTLQATTAAPGDFTISPSNLTFGPTEIGNVSAAQTAIISAPNGHPVTIQGGSSDFLLLSTGTCATQTPCQISVSFKPTAAGQRNATYQVTDIATGESYYLSLTGSGGILTVSLSPASLTFAARDEGTTSIPQTITVTNTGDIYMIATGVVLAGANPGDFFIQSNTCVTAQQNDVAPGDSCSISVSFNPTASGARSATLQIISNSSTSPDTVQLSGTGN